MKLLLANPRGFCAGVVRAIQTVEKALEKWGPPIYIKHEIVHNQHVVNRLKERGAIFIEDLQEIPSGSRVIYSAHGVSPAVRREAQRLNLIEIDATCILVNSIHQAIKRYAAENYKVIIIGHKKHVEVIGAAGEAPDVTYIVENATDVAALPIDADEKIFYITQTTLSVYDVKKITRALHQRFSDIETLQTSSICYATTNRQRALKQITNHTDMVLVVGDPKSSNSNRLREIAAQNGIPAYLINDKDEINPAWLQDVEIIGLTAGASTPENIVQDIIAYLMKLGVDKVEDVAYTKENVVFTLPQEVR
ncbi:MAG: 4-hydroxy-3-methylbut-2-enyl diphosphate reductase [Chlamydiota bacterium]